MIVVSVILNYITQILKTIVDVYFSFASILIEKQIPKIFPIIRVVG